MVYNSELPQIKIRILNFVRSNPGYGVETVSKMINIPVNVVRVAVLELQNEGLLQKSNILKIDRKIN